MTDKLKTPKNAKDLENLDGKAGMTWEEAQKEMHKDKGKGKVIPSPRPQDLPDPHEKNVVY